MSPNLLPVLVAFAVALAIIVVAALDLSARDVAFIALAISALVVLSVLYLLAGLGQKAEQWADAITGSIVGGEEFDS